MQRPIHITINDDKWIRLRRPAAMALLLAVLALGVTAGAWISDRHNLDGAGMLLAAATTAPIADQLSLGAGFTPVVERVLPAVVSISSEKMIRFADSGIPLLASILTKTCRTAATTRMSNASEASVRASLSVRTATC